MAESLTLLRIERRFRASAERVFDAWTDPAVAGAWLFTTPASERHAVSIDAKVGGRWEIIDRRDGVDYRAIGEYLELDRPRRLVTTFAMPQFSPDAARLTVEITPDGAGCLMVLTHEPLPPQAVDATRDGWLAMFDGLDEVLQGLE
jgi:uncharacterized protein YndB with AHSA1/START domain